jgi:hypothetical protein
MNTLTDNDFHHRIDLFEPGDTTALVCVDVPEVQRLTVDNLTELGCKIHTGLFVEDIMLKLQTHAYDVVVIAEQFSGTDLRANPILQATLEIPPAQRRKQLVVLVGASFHTDSDMQSWANSADLVVNLADVPNIKHVLRRCMQRSRVFYTPYSEALVAAGLS